LLPFIVILLGVPEAARRAAAPDFVPLLAASVTEKP